MFTYGHTDKSFSKYYRVAKLYTVYLTVSGIIRPSLKCTNTESIEGLKGLTYPEGLNLILNLIHIFQQCKSCNNMYFL